MRRVATVLLAVLLVSLVAVPQASAALPPKPVMGETVTGTGTTGLLDMEGPVTRLLRHANANWVWPDWSDSYDPTGEVVDIGTAGDPAGTKTFTIHDSGIKAILVDQWSKVGTWELPEAVIFPDAQPGTKSGRTLAPIRFLFENMGYKVTWLPDKPNEVRVTGKGHDILLFLGEKRAIVDGQEKTLDVAPLVWHNRTYLPLRFLFESVGAVVGWDNETKFAWIWTDPNDPSIDVASQAKIAITR